MSFVIKLIPAFVLGLALTLGTFFANDAGEFGALDFDNRGFPFSYIQDELKQNPTGERLLTYDDQHTDFQVLNFMGNWAVWTMVALAALFVLKKLRNTAGNLIIAGVVVAMLLVYFGVIAIA